VLEPVEARIMVTAAFLMLGLAVLFWFFPRSLTYPLIVILAWISFALLYKAYRLEIRGEEQTALERERLEIAERQKEQKRI
jgi:hypothetical protein